MGVLDLGKWCQHRVQEEGEGIENGRNDGEARLLVQIDREIRVRENSFGAFRILFHSSSRRLLMCSDDVGMVLAYYIHERSAPESIKQPA